MTSVGHAFAVVAVFAVCSPRPCVPDDYPVDVAAEDLGSPVFRVENGRVIAEAESLVGGGYGKEWRVSKEKNYHAEGDPPAGGAFVVAAVDRQGGAMLSVDQHARGKSLGIRASWLQFRFYVGPGQEGTYGFGWRQAHILHDGDNDVFPAALGVDVKDVARAGWGPTRRFNWYSNGVTLDAKRPGLYGFVLISRSRGYAADRLVAWKGAGKGVPVEVRDLSLPESRRWLSVEGMPGIAPLVQANAYGRAWSRLNAPGENPEAVRARETLEKHVTDLHDSLVALRATDPAGAFESLEKAARLYRGVPQAGAMSRTARAWAKDPELRKAVSARRVLVEFKKQHAQLVRALKGRSVSDPRVRRQVGARIAPVLSLYRAIRRSGAEAEVAEARAALAKVGFDERVLAP